MSKNDYNRIIKILDILSMEGNDAVHISNDRESYTLGASRYSLKVTEFLQKEKCNFRIDHKENQHHWIISMK